MENIIEKNKRKFTVLDFPQKGVNSGVYSGSSPSTVASKIFNKLAKKLNFYDNEGGKKYLVFYMQDINSKKIYPYIGTVVILQKPIEINYSQKNIKINHRNIVAKYDNNMKEVFKKYLH